LWRGVLEKKEPLATPAPALDADPLQPTPAASDAARDRALSRLAALPGMRSTPLSALEAAPAGPLAAGGGGGLLTAAPPRARRTWPAPPSVTDGRATALASAALIKATLRDEVDPAPTAPPPRTSPPPPLPARRAAVRAAFAHTWAGYVAHAWGEDELAPVSRAGYESLCGIGVTILDSLDTLALLGFPRELARARAWVAAQDWVTGRQRQRQQQQQQQENDATTTTTKAATVGQRAGAASAGCVGSTFEATIRGLGGLVAAFDLTGDAAYLAAADGLAGRLLPAFGTPSGLPAPSVLLVPPRARGEGHGRASADDDDDDDDDDNAVGPDSPPPRHHSPPRFTYLAEAGSVQLEFVRLAALLDRPDLAATAERAVAAILDANPGGGDGNAPGLYPTTLALETGGGVFLERHSVGGRAD